LVYHLAALAFLVAISYLVYRLAFLIYADRWHSAVSAVIFASASAILYDVMAWAVGIYDLLGLLFVLLGAISLFRCRLVYASVFFVLALFSRFYASPYLWLVDAGHPYHIGSNKVASSAIFYLVALSNVIYFSASFGVYSLLPILLKFNKKNYLLLAATAFCIVPFTFLENHLYAYYACYALIPFSIAVAHLFGERRFYIPLAAMIVLSGFYFSRAYDKASYTDGYNNLPRKAYEILKAGR
jgi:hypothetical protein